MRKIGIITTWGASNYGAWLQAYALRNVIEQITHDDVRTVAYMSKKTYRKTIQIFLFGKIVLLLF